jgi:DNA polymerase II large subunit
MKKEIRCDCGICNQIVDTQIICDICGEKLRDYSRQEIGKAILNHKGNPIKLTIEGVDYDFDCLQCLLLFIAEELKKEKKND